MKDVNAPGACYVAAIVAASLLTTPASAQRISANPFGIEPAPGSDTGAIRSGPYTENFEQFSIGTLDGQAGWYGQLDASVVGDGISGQSVRHQSSSSLGGPILAMRSPMFDAAFERLDFDIMLTSASTTYYIEAVNIDTGLVNTRLQFNLDGGVSVFQVLSNGVGYLPSTGNWSQGALSHMSIQSAPSGDLLIYKDGQRIFWGKDVVAAITNGTTGIQRFSIVADGFGAGDEIIIDNIAIMIPAPGASAILAPALLFASRRRRRSQNRTD